MTAWFYILRLQSGELYIGATKNLKKRYEEHNAGTAGRTTSLDPPVSLAYYEELESFSKARPKLHISYGFHNVFLKMYCMLRYNYFDKKIFVPIMAIAF